MRKRSIWYQALALAYWTLDVARQSLHGSSTTLNEFEKLCRQRGMKSPDRFNETHQFRCGNGEVETSHIGVAMPVTLGPHRGAIRASIVQGSAPLLISRSAPKKLDFQKDTLSILGSPPIQLRTNSAGWVLCRWLGTLLLMKS